MWKSTKTWHANSGLKISQTFENGFRFGCQHPVKTPTHTHTQRCGDDGVGSVTHTLVFPSIEGEGGNADTHTHRPKRDCILK
jgi:hypothetical protein